MAITDKMNGRCDHEVTKNKLLRGDLAPSSGIYGGKCRFAVPMSGVVKVIPTCVNMPNEEAFHEKDSVSKESREGGCF